jgi:hypothetical protein
MVCCPRGYRRWRLRRKLGVACKPASFAQHRVYMKEGIICLPEYGHLQAVILHSDSTLQDDIKQLPQKKTSPQASTYVSDSCARPASWIYECSMKALKALPYMPISVLKLNLRDSPKEVPTLPMLPCLRMRSSSRKLVRLSRLPRSHSRRVPSVLPHQHLKIR